MRQLTGRIPGMPPQFGGAFGFIEAPFERVVDEFVAWHADLGFGPMRTDLDSGLKQAALRLLPLGRAAYVRSLVVGTRGDRWTGYFDSQQSGGDPRPPVGVLGTRLGVATVVVHATPFSNEEGAVHGHFGSLQWEYSPDGSLQKQRSIALVEGESSSGLHFEAWGDVQPWENPESYTARRKRDRFALETIDAYCRAVGIEPFDLDFYAGPSALVKRTKHPGDAG